MQRVGRSVSMPPSSTSPVSETETTVEAVMTSQNISRNDLKEITAEFKSSSVLLSNLVSSLAKLISNSQESLKKLLENRKESMSRLSNDVSTYVAKIDDLIATARKTEKEGQTTSDALNEKYDQLKDLQKMLMEPSFKGFVDAEHALLDGISELFSSSSAVDGPKNGLTDVLYDPKKPQVFASREEWLPAFKKYEPTATHTRVAALEELQMASEAYATHAKQSVVDKMMNWSSNRQLEVSSSLQVLSTTMQNVKSETKLFQNLSDTLDGRLDAFTSLAENLGSATNSEKQLSTSVSAFKANAKKEAKLVIKLPTLAASIQTLSEWIELLKLVVAYKEFEDLSMFRPLWQRMQELVSLRAFKNSSVYKDLVTAAKEFCGKFKAWNDGKVAQEQFARDASLVNSEAVLYWEWVASVVSSIRSYRAQMKGFLESSTETEGQFVEEIPIGVHPLLNVNLDLLSDVRKTMDSYSSIASEYAKRSKALSKMKSSHEGNEKTVLSKAKQMTTVEEAFPSMIAVFVPHLQNIQRCLSLLDAVELMVNENIRDVYNRDRPNVLLKLDEGDFEGAAAIEDTVEAMMEPVFAHVNHLHTEKKDELGRDFSDLHSDLRALRLQRSRGEVVRAELFKKRGEHKGIAQRADEEWAGIIQDQSEAVKTAYERACRELSEAWKAQTSTTPVQEEPAILLPSDST
eukprot:ANDGO_03622.mRNA.1 hypothetical protein